MRSTEGRFLKGLSYSPGTQFAKGEHWRRWRPHWEREWLLQRYAVEQKTSSEIAKECGCTEENIIFWLRKHSIPRRSVSEVRKVKKWAIAGTKNGMYGRTGPSSPTWKGGYTPLRQQFYASGEWKLVKRTVRERDKVCILCGDRGIEYHHIIPFRTAPLLALEADNVCLLCVSCHKRIGRNEKRWQKKLFAIIAGKEVSVR